MDASFDFVLETWRSIPGYDGYSVSDQGRVRNDSTGRVLTPWPHRRVHPYWKVKIGHHNSLYIHRAVLLAFVGEPPPGYDAAHLNDDPSDNRLVNLRWLDTPSNRNNRTAFKRKGA